MNAVLVKGRQLRRFEWRMASGSVGMDDILLLAIFITIPKMHINVSVSLFLISSDILTSLLPQEICLICS